METILSFVASAFINLYGVSALVLFCIGIYWLFNKKARQKQIAKLRAKLAQLKPTDPEYNAVRALYVSMMIDAHRSEVFHGSDAGGDANAAHGDGGSHSGSDHS